MQNVQTARVEDGRNAFSKQYDTPQKASTKKEFSRGEIASALETIKPHLLRMMKAGKLNALQLRALIVPLLKTLNLQLDRKQVNELVLAAEGLFKGKANNLSLAKALQPFVGMTIAGYTANKIYIGKNGEVMIDYTDPSGKAGKISFSELTKKIAKMGGLKNSITKAQTMQKRKGTIFPSMKGHQSVVARSFISHLPQAPRPFGSMSQNVAPRRNTSHRRGGFSFGNN